MDEEEEIDIGPLTVEQLQGLARDMMLQIRQVAVELAGHGVHAEPWLMDRLENQLCDGMEGS